MNKNTLCLWRAVVQPCRKTRLRALTHGSRMEGVSHQRGEYRPIDFETTNGRWEITRVGLCFQLIGVR